MRYEAVARKRLVKSNRQHRHHQLNSRDRSRVRPGSGIPRSRELGGNRDTEGSLHDDEPGEEAPA